MTPADAARLLDLAPDASPEQLEARFLQLRAQLEDRIAKAPTPGLKEKYRASLNEITTAFEVLTLAADSSDLPVIQQEAAPSPATPAVPAAATSTPGPARPAPKAGGNREFAVVALIAILLLGGGIWWVVQSRAQAAEKARLESAAKTEAERLATLQARHEAEAGAAAEAEAARLRAQLAEGRVRWEAFEREAQTAERRLSDLRSDARAARDLTPSERAELEATLGAQQNYVDWIQTYLLRQPAKTLMARLDALLSARAVDEATQVDAELTDALTAADAEVAAQRVELLTTAAPLRVASDPAGLAYEVRDSYGRVFTGTTPLDTEAPLGAATIRVSRSGWPDQVREIELRRGQTAEVRLDFPSSPVRLASEPEGLAYELVDRFGNTRRGMTPAELPDVPVGGATLKVTREGWPDQVRKLTVTRDEAAAVSLEFPGGLARIASEPPGAAFEISNAFGFSRRGTTPAELTDVPAGAVSVKIARNPWPEFVKKVEIGRDQPVEVSATFPPGSLTVTSEPAGAAVFIAGRQAGTTPLALQELAPGEREVTVRMKGHVSRQQTIAVTAGNAAEVAVTLEPNPVLEADKPYKVPVIDLALVPIPAGRFMMGSPAKEPGRRTSEGPQMRVTLTRGFWLGRTEVTVGQWKQLMGTDLRAQVRKMLKDDNTYSLGGKQQTFRQWKGLERDADPYSQVGNEGDDLPMHYVSWDDAMEFCRRLTEQERADGRLPPGYRYTLPTEAQWEHAARAGTSHATYVGPIEILGLHNAPIVDKIAWYGGNSSNGYSGRGWNTEKWKEKQYPGGRAGPRAVATRQPNSWGLYDILGNVQEWTSSAYGKYPGGRVKDYVGPASGDRRVYRGGSWASEARAVRAACRFWEVPGVRHRNIGFRLALVSD